MASSIIFGIFIILLETYITSGTCEDYFVEVDTHNVSFTFYFGWNSSETKHVQCFHGSNTIGECYYIFEFECPLKPTSPGVYNMSTNTDLTVVNVTILTFNSTTSGNYSCSKDSGTTTITKCVKPSVITTTQPTTNTTSPTEDLTKLIGPIGGSFIGFVVGVCIVVFSINRVARSKLREYNSSKTLQETDIELNTSDRETNRIDRLEMLSHEIAIQKKKVIAINKHEIRTHKLDMEKQCEHKMRLEKHAHEFDTSERDLHRARASVRVKDLHNKDNVDVHIQDKSNIEIDNLYLNMPIDSQKIQDAEKHIEWCNTNIRLIEQNKGVKKHDINASIDDHKGYMNQIEQEIAIRIHKMNVRMIEMTQREKKMELDKKWMEKIGCILSKCNKIDNNNENATTYCSDMLGTEQANHKRELELQRKFNEEKKNRENGYYFL